MEGNCAEFRSALNSNFQPRASLGQSLQGRIESVGRGDLCPHPENGGQKKRDQRQHAPFSQFYPDRFFSRPLIHNPRKASVSNAGLNLLPLRFFLAKPREHLEPELQLFNLRIDLGVAFRGVRRGVCLDRIRRRGGVACGGSVCILGTARRSGARRIAYWEMPLFVRSKAW